MIGPHIINYNLIRSSKKNLSLQIKNGELIARAPIQMKKSQIDDFIFKKIDWIKKNLVKKKIQQTYNNGDVFLYLGEEYPLIIKNKTLKFDGKNFIGIGGKAEFLSLYKKHFIALIQEKIIKIAKKNNFKYNCIRFKAQKTRWGSCSAKNNINLNYLLMMAPIGVIENVIIHELCHITHKNHSQKFWDLVYKVKPDYKTHNFWLKNNSKKISKILI